MSFARDFSTNRPRPTTWARSSQLSRLVVDFLGQAFGEFEPQRDPFAAVKFALSSAFLDDRLDELRALVTENHDTGGVSGEPGWIIERKDVDHSHEYYAAWPAWARFRAFVDPEMYELANPECFMDRASFLD